MEPPALDIAASCGVERGIPEFEGRVWQILPWSAG